MVSYLETLCRLLFYEMESKRSYACRVVRIEEFPRDAERCCTRALCCTQTGDMKRRQGGCLLRGAALPSSLLP